jgi:glycosyltransferase involved in cell wall biosynthesis
VKGHKLIDVLIQTYNEELNLPTTLASVKGWVNRIFVVDSGSTDNTRKIAEEMGATVVSHPWEGYAQQKNWALRNLHWEAPWILILDADEAVSEKLKQRILSVVTKSPDDVPEAGFYLNRVFVFLGKQIRHCGYYPSWNLRLFKAGQAFYDDRLVHEHMDVKGPTGYFPKPDWLIHEDRRGLEHFFAKHNRYSTLEAREIFEKPQKWPGWGRFFTDRVARRRFLKSRVVPKVPFSWVMRFIYMYILRGGVLDGMAGWKLCLFISAYEFLIQTKYKELGRLRKLGLVEPKLAGLREPEGSLSRLEETGLTTPVRTPTAVEPLPTAEAIVPTTVAGSRAALSHSLVQPVPSGIDVRSPKIATVVKDDVADPLAQSPSRGRVLESEVRIPREPGIRVSVVIPTLNEESNMPRCLDHLKWADEVVVVDSGSTDRTVEIAHAYGCKVVDFDWNGQWPKKKNWALRHIDFKHDWVLIVDADEWITPELAREIEAAIRNPERVGYYVNRKFIFMGRWIKHCGYYPSWNLRLIKRGMGEYEQLTGVGNTGSGDNEVHEHVVPHGPAGYLDNDMLHFAFPTIHTFMEKHNRYSNWEAAVQYNKAEAAPNSSIGVELSKRRKLKNLSRSLPFRPTLRFLYSYIWRLGILDGKPGYVFCRLLGIYEYLSVAKYVELKRAEDDRVQARSLSNVPPTDWRANVNEAATSAQLSAAASPGRMNESSVLKR